MWLEENKSSELRMADKMAERPFMDCFYALADLDAEVRHAAALDVSAHLCDVARHGPGGAPGLNAKAWADNVAYAVKRLVRGLGSSRGCARQGFSLALGALLRLRVGQEGLESTTRTSKNEQRNKRKKKGGAGTQGAYVVPDLFAVLAPVSYTHLTLPTIYSV